MGKREKGPYWAPLCDAKAAWRTHRKNEDDRDECDGDDDLGHDGSGLGPAVPDPHS